MSAGDVQAPSAANWRWRTALRSPLTILREVCTSCSSGTGSRTHSPSLP